MSSYYYDLFTTQILKDLDVVDIKEEITFKQIPHSLLLIL